MKSIICFTESLGGGGAEHQMVLLAQFLLEEGYDVSIVTYADVSDHYDISPSINRKRLAKGKSRFIKFISVFFFFLTIDADCVISYRKMCNVRLLIPLLFRSKKIKVICSERNTTFGKPDFTMRLLIHYLYNRSDYIVSNSFSQMRFILHERPNLGPKLVTIHNYTDLQHYVPVHHPSTNESMNFVIFARFSSQKNPLLFIEAMARLKDRTKIKFQVHWYGSKEDDPYYQIVKKSAEDLCVTDVFFMHPAVKDPFVLMSHFHAACLPSIYEGFSNSIAEAICCGMPMLVSDVADNSIMVRDGVNGFLFDPNDIDSICNSFINFINLSDSERSQFSVNSRSIAEELFDKRVFITRYIKLIES
ncbi:MAG: glycosyltransferase [Bacteroidales bacterium]|nr:glycosyltransferase [Bacteroidales bacterium]